MPDGSASAPARPSAFPWDDALALGLGALGWSPAAFWAATPREFAAALGRRRGPEPLSRDAFERLLAAYPDPGSTG
ncbi:phage tail assembly chaperone [Methylobacterium sp. GXF4]|uniref:phage tail assembly chaperone n=1 Tax=Methylobacterium sp. GXF4 TaxID=1096546 RepID=UPI0002D5DA53|nr:phage tail assembly chaperone [Methylobacterium sp. GXF4]